MKKHAKTMKAAVYRGASKVQIESLPIPAISSEEILVEVKACGVCPTDIKKIQHGTLSPPRVFGHETAGVIAKIGRRVRGFKVGDRVALHHHVPCLECHACRHRAFAQCQQYKKTGITAGFEPSGGGFAQFVRVMPFVFPGVVKIPAKNSFLEGAMLEPVSTVLKAVNQLRVLSGDVVWVIGQGPIGLLFTALLTSKNIRVLATDFMESRLVNSRKLGARWALKADSANLEETILKSTCPQGVDAAVVSVPSNSAVVTAYRVVNSGGKILLFGHTTRNCLAQVDLGSVCVDEKALLGSYSSDFLLQREAARLVFSRAIPTEPLVSHHFGLEHAPEAIALAAQPTVDSLKVMITPNQLQR